MPDFAYTARSASGQAVTGTIAAPSPADALRLIRAEGNFPVAVRPADARRAQAAAAPAGIGAGRLSRADLIQLSMQLAMMTETGVTLSEALSCIADQADRPNVRAIVSDLSQRIQGGASFSDALARHPRSFPPLYMALVRASEKSGMMSRMLTRATGYLRDEQEILRKVRGALVYPAIMFTFALGTTIFLLSFVLPRFTVIYATKNAVLPLPTRILMAASNFLVHNYPALIAATAVGAMVLATAARSPTGRRCRHWLQLRWPLLGKMYRKLHLARGLRMVGTLAGAGVGLMDCVTVAHDLCPNGYFKDLWTSVADRIQAGRQFSDALFASPLVPRSVAQMLHSGEKSGKLPAVMEQVSGYAEQELKEEISALTRYIEPAMIIGMGILIGSVCLALLLPIFTISKVMGR